MAKDNPEIIEHRNTMQKTAIVFVHGFAGHAIDTWQQFPQLIINDARLNGWDIFSIGYPSKFFPDLAFGWRSDPPLDILAQSMSTLMAVTPLNQVEAMVIIAHSMGGLVVQRAILDETALRNRIQHIFFFGTPSAGLGKAKWFSKLLPYLKRQVTGMAKEGDFIRNLRPDWDAAEFDFNIWAIAGELDVFVPPASSLHPFPVEQRAVVPGDHESMIKPNDVNSRAYKIVAESIIGNAAPAGPWNSANVAVELGEFRKAIAILEPNAKELDEQATVQLALALESVGREGDALHTLSNAQLRGTDGKGVLAGRLKRRWHLKHRLVDLNAAYSLYKKAYEEALLQSDYSQAFYHGINLAFLDFIAFQSPENAMLRAREVLRHCEKCPTDYWKLATEGEALLILGDVSGAKVKFIEAMELEAPPRQIASTYKQAAIISKHMNSKIPLEMIESVFKNILIAD